MSDGEAKHSKGIRKDQFCALRKKNCGHNQYREVCRPTTWDKYQAHHLLCVASVTEFIGIKPEIEDIVKQTEWCINAQPNMVALPVWSVTVRHYCNLLIVGAPSAPPAFVNRPQHDYDHNSKLGYLQEVDTRLRKLANQVEKKKDDHTIGVQTLLDGLNGLSAYFKGELNRRGSARSGGTHIAWEDAMGNNDSKTWYKPFSMANDGCEDERRFPGLNLNKAQQILKRIIGYWG